MKYKQSGKNQDKRKNVSLSVNAGNLLSGKEAEHYAAQYLTQQGLEILAQNYRCKLGEVDLVMRDKSTIVFVEVRSRKHSRYGSSIESVDHRKQRRLVHAAQHYLLKYQLSNRVICRFDILGINTAKINKDPYAAITWVPDAFQSG